MTGLLVLFLIAVALWVLWLKVGLGAGVGAATWWSVRAMIGTGVFVVGPAFGFLLAWGLAMHGVHQLFGDVGSFMLAIPLGLVTFVGWKLFEWKVTEPRILPWLERVIGPAPGELRARAKEVMQEVRSGQVWMERAAPTGSTSGPVGVPESKSDRAKPMLPAGLDSPAASTD